MKTSPGIKRTTLLFLAFALSNISIGAPPRAIREIPKTIQYGTVMEAFPFTTDGIHTGGGMAAGAAIGAATQIDAIFGPYICVGDPTAMVLAGLAGGVVGMKIEKAMNSERFVKIHVLLDDGREVVVTQPAGKQKFKVHDEVKILYYSRNLKKVHHRGEYVEWETNPYIVTPSNARKPNP